MVLLNGKRISGFSEIQDYPTEAIARIDILPPEVSLSYGYSANQKVVNIVLRRRFKAVLADLRGGMATDGERKTGSATGNILHIREDNRVNLDVKYTTADRLLESDRGVATTAARRPYSLGGNIVSPTGGQIDPALSALAGVPVTLAAVPGSAASGQPQLSDFVAGANVASISDLGRFRTLSPATDTVTVNGVYARTLPGGISGSLNGRLDYSSSDSLRGLPSASLLIPAGNPYSPFADPVQLYRYIDQAGPLAQHSKAVTGHIGLTLNGDLRPWHWSFTGNYDRSVTRTSTARGFDLTRFRMRSPPEIRWSIRSAPCRGTFSISGWPTRPARLPPASAAASCLTGRCSNSRRARRRRASRSAPRTTASTAAPSGPAS